MCPARQMNRGVGHKGVVQAKDKFAEVGPSAEAHKQKSYSGVLGRHVLSVMGVKTEEL